MPLYRGSRRLILRRRVQVAVGGGLDSATNAWVSAVVAAGGSVSGGWQTAIDTYIKGLKADGVWTILDRLWIPGGESTVQADIDLVGLSTWTKNGTISFSAGHGYTGGGSSTDYIDTGWNPSTGPNWAQNSASFMGYILTNRTSNAAAAMIGGTTGGNDAVYLDPLNAGNAYFDLNEVNFPNAASTTSQGCWIASRTGASASFMRRNATAFQTSAAAVGAVQSTRNIFVSANNNNGTTNAPSTDQFFAISLGGALSTAQADALANRTNTLATSLGINVY